MPEIIIKDVKIPRGLAASWAAKNPVLGDGIQGYERDTQRMKVGDGVRRWNDLPYLKGATSGGGAEGLLEHIEADAPHPVYDDGPSLLLLYENAKV